MLQNPTAKITDLEFHKGVYSIPSERPMRRFLKQYWPNMAATGLFLAGAVGGRYFGGHSIASGCAVLVASAVSAMFLETFDQKRQEREWIRSRDMEKALHKPQFSKERPMDHIL